MATEGSFRCDGANYVAGADLSAKQFFAAVATGANTLGLQTSLGGRMNGVIQNKPVSGQAVNICFEGFSKAAAGAAIAADAELAVDATGRFITAVTGNQVVGQAVESAGAAGVIFTMRVYDTAYVKP